MSDFNKEEVKNEITEEVAPVAEEKAEKPKAKSSKKAQKESNHTDDFIARKLKVINMMNNPAKQTRLAERVLNNRKAGK